jgi:hypothetical protein
MRNEFEWMWKKVVIAYLKISRHSPERTEKNHEIPQQELSAPRQRFEPSTSWIKVRRFTALKNVFGGRMTKESEFELRQDIFLCSKMSRPALGLSNFYPLCIGEIFMGQRRLA